MGLEKVEALQNLVVLDLTRVVAGPYAGSILGDFGAEVIKIEVPGKGDDARSYGPYRNGESVYYANLNRNKKRNYIEFEDGRREKNLPGTGE